MAEIKRSTGVNESEKILGQWCDRAFLEAWTYHNPHRAKGTELCDSLVVFNGHILIFQIKEIKFSGGDVHMAWERWKRRAFTAQLKSLEGAKNWILNHPDRIYQDAACKKRLPIDIASGNYKIHKILVAQGASEASQNYFFDNIFGNLRIKYGTSESDSPVQFPFTLFLSKHDPVHVLDARSLAIVLRELDTAFDFTEYLLVKERDIQKHSALSYPGEENLLAYYLFHFDERNNQHYISVVDDSTSVLSIAADWWEGLMEDPDYKRKKAADEISYLWDLLMHDVCKLAFEGTTTGNANLFSQQNAIYEMAKEPRYWRRVLAEALRDSIQKQINSTGGQRHLSLRNSFHKGTAYVFFWVDRPSKLSEGQFRQMRKGLLNLACGAAKNSQPQFTKIVGITHGLSIHGKPAMGDFLLMDCKEWTEEDKSRYEEANKVTKFFGAESVIRRTTSMLEPPEE